VIYEKQIALLKRVRDLTEKGKIKWVETETNDLYEANMNGQRAVIEFLYVEATNRAGADKQLIQIVFPGFNAFLACGTEGFDLVVEILDAGFESWKQSLANYGNYANDFLAELEQQ